MNVYEPTRAKLHQIVTAFHAANYPNTQVNYPGRWHTDIEQVAEPFVGVEYDFTSRALSLPASHCRRVTGMLVLNLYAREGSGRKIFTDYADALDNYLGLKTLEGITFREVNPHNNSGRPGFDGVMNVVNFYIDYF